MFWNIRNGESQVIPCITLHPSLFIFNKIPLHPPSGNTPWQVMCSQYSISQVHLFTAILYHHSLPLLIFVIIIHASAAFD